MQKQTVLEIFVINSFIRLSFENMKNAVMNVEVSQLLLSPYLITECMMNVDGTGKTKLPLVELHDAVMKCFDGVACHLHGYEEVSVDTRCDSQRISPVLMKFFISTLQAVFDAMQKFAPEPSTVCTEAQPEQ